MFIKINKSDNKNTRNAKKSFRVKLKSKKKRRKNLNRNIFLNPISNSNSSYYTRLQLSEEINNFYNKNESKIWRNTNNSKVINLTDDFNLFDNSDKVIGTLLNLILKAKTNHEFLTLNYKSGSNLTGALYFIDTICWEIARSKKWFLKLNHLPSIETEILTNLRSFKTNSSENKYTYIVNSKIKINRIDDKLAKQEHREKSKEIRDLIQRGMQETEKDSSIYLSNTEHNAIDSSISEHFDNILLHAPNAQFGHLCGIYDKVNKIVTILIYNFGKSISETLDNEELPKHVEEFKRKIILNHSENNFFSMSKVFNKENALTLLAIQEGISSMLNADISRGHGLVDFIEHCFELSKKTKITFVSGNTSIKIDNKYLIKQMNVLDRERRIIALNDENNIFNKPNKDYVKNTKYYFPGVIIETIIPLN